MHSLECHTPCFCTPDNEAAPIASLQVNIRVTTMDAELEFAIQPATTGKQLFDQVSSLGRNNVLITRGGWS